MAHAMTSMDLDMDDSHFGIDGIVRVVYVAAAIAIWRTTTYMLAPAGAVDTGVVVEKETIDLTQRSIHSTARTSWRQAFSVPSRTTFCISDAATLSRSSTQPVRKSQRESRKRAHGWYARDF